jgi:hypothetical protein
MRLLLHFLGARMPKKAPTKLLQLPTLESLIGFCQCDINSHPRIDISGKNNFVYRNSESPQYFLTQTYACQQVN